nr:type VI immunity family protein [Herbaspirillum sp. ASV7]
MSLVRENIEALVPDFPYVEQDRIVTTIGFAASFYFWEGHTTAKRRALVECIEAFEHAYADRLKWGCDPDSWNTIKLADKRLPALRDYVASLDADNCVEWHLSSSAHREEVADFSITCMTKRAGEDKQMSWLAFQVPRSHAFDEHHRQQLEALLLLMIERLSPFHGHAGLTVVCPELAIPYEGDVLDVATRYRGLYIEGAGDLICAQSGPKSIDWFSVGGDVLAERLGGAQAYADYCRQCVVEPIRCGQALILRSANAPHLGPVAEPLQQSYVVANGALRSLRDGAYDSMGGRVHQWRDTLQPLYI